MPRHFTQLDNRSELALCSFCWGPLKSSRNKRFVENICCQSESNSSANRRVRRAKSWQPLSGAPGEQRYSRTMNQSSSPLADRVEVVETLRDTHITLTLVAELICVLLRVWTLCRSSGGNTESSRTCLPAASIWFGVFSSSQNDSSSFEQGVLNDCIVRKVVFSCLECRRPHFRRSASHSSKCTADQ